MPSHQRTGACQQPATMSNAAAAFRRRCGLQLALLILAAACAGAMAVSEEADTQELPLTADGHVDSVHGHAQHEHEHGQLKDSSDEPHTCPHSAAAGAPDFSQQGPYTALANFSQPLQVKLGGSNSTLLLHLTFPDQASASRPQKLPLLLFFNGFELSAIDYTSYAHRIASWGYVVFQYDLPPLIKLSWLPGVTLPFKQIVRDDDEVAMLPQLIAWLHGQVDQPGGPVYKAVDFSKVAVMGHSRGGKLAALVLAGQYAPNPPGQGSGLGVDVSAAILVDPVDLNPFTQLLKYPSAVKALEDLGATAAVVGAGISSWKCNSASQGYQQFWKVLGPGSWQTVVLQASHMTFTDNTGWFVTDIDWICDVGKIPHQVAMDATYPVAVAWLQKHLRPSSETSAGLERFQQWVQQQNETGLLTYNFTG